MPAVIEFPVGMRLLTNRRLRNGIIAVPAESTEHPGEASMNQLIENLFAFVNRQSRQVQCLITAGVLLVMLDQCMTAGESIGKALFHFLH
jgi:hypothetical protein